MLPGHQNSPTHLGVCALQWLGRTNRLGDPALAALSRACSTACKQSKHAGGKGEDGVAPPPVSISALFRTPAESKIAG